MNSEVSRATTTANAASTSMKQSNFDAILVAGCYNILLSLVQLPCSSETSSIFTRIRISNHYLVTKYNKQNSSYLITR